METTEARIRAVIRQTWESQGLTQTQVADASQIPRSTFDRLIDGIGHFKLDQIERIAAALGVTVTDLTTKAEAA